MVGRHTVMLLNLYTTSGLSILLHGIISLPDAMSFDKGCIHELADMWLVLIGHHKFHQFTDETCVLSRAV